MEQSAPIVVPVYSASVARNEFSFSFLLWWTMISGRLGASQVPKYNDCIYEGNLN